MCVCIKCTIYALHTWKYPSLFFIYFLMLYSSLAAVVVVILIAVMVVDVFLFYFSFAPILHSLFEAKIRFFIRSLARIVKRALENHPRKWGKCMVNIWSYVNNCCCYCCWCCYTLVSMCLAHSILYIFSRAADSKSQFVIVFVCRSRCPYTFLPKWLVCTPNGFPHFKSATDGRLSMVFFRPSFLRLSVVPSFGRAILR